MRKTKFNIVLGLAVCAVLVPMIVSAKEKVERPFKLHGQQTIVADLSNYPDPMIPWWIEWESGQATHFGLYTSLGTGTHNLVNDVINATGYVTAANGDRVYWEAAGQAGAPLICTFTGGTGRFEGAGGSFTLTSITESEEWDPDFPWLLRITYSLSGIGTITY